MVGPSQALPLTPALSRKGEGEPPSTSAITRSGLPDPFWIFSGAAITINDTLADGSGRYYSFTSTSDGNIISNWVVSYGTGSKNIRVIIYSGTPHGAGTGVYTGAPSASNIVADSGTVGTTSVNLQYSNAPAGTYTVLFYSYGGADPSTTTQTLAYRGGAGCP